MIIATISCGTNTYDCSYRLALANNRQYKQQIKCTFFIEDYIVTQGKLKIITQITGLWVIWCDTYIVQSEIAPPQGRVTDYAQRLFIF